MLPISHHNEPKVGGPKALYVCFWYEHCTSFLCRQDSSSRSGIVCNTLPAASIVLHCTMTWFNVVQQCCAYCSGTPGRPPHKCSYKKYIHGWGGNTVTS